jgi:hypothetical protein
MQRDEDTVQRVQLKRIVFTISAHQWLKIGPGHFDGILTARLEASFVT